MSSSCPLAVSMTIGISSPCWRTARQISYPFTLGSMMSSRIKSGCAESASFNPLSPSAAACLAREALVHLVEAAEDFLAFARGDADSVVLHRKDHVPVPGKGLEDDVFLARRVLARVVQQVEQHGSQRVLVGTHRRQSGSQIDLHGKAILH